jgi:hypothetical protein
VRGAVLSTKKRPESRADLQRRILELNAQLAHVYHFASAALPKASTSHLMASGCLLQLHALGGRELINPVVIRDGLSPDTIAALQRDLARSYDLTVAFKPKVTP